MNGLYIRVINDQIKFPYSLNTDLKFDHPRTSFPAVLTDELLAHFGIFPCLVANDRQEDTLTHTWVLGEPTQDKDGTWSVLWVMNEDGEAVKEAKFNQLVEQTKTSINNDYLNSLIVLHDDYDEHEIRSWVVQYTEASNFIFSEGAAQTPMINLLARAKGISVAEFANLVIENAKTYNEQYGAVLANKKARVKQVDITAAQALPLLDKAELIKQI